MAATDLYIDAIGFVKTVPKISQAINKRDNDPNIVLLQVICRAYAYKGEMGFSLEIIFDYRGKNVDYPGQPDMIINVLPLSHGGFQLMK